jgi:hypothetical protein
MKKLISTMVVSAAVGLCLAGRVAGAQTVTNAGGVGLAGTVETFVNPDTTINQQVLYTVPSGKWFAITQTSCPLIVQDGLNIGTPPGTSFVPAFIVPAGTAIEVDEEAGASCWVTGILG